MNSKTSRALDLQGDREEVSKAPYEIFVTNMMPRKKANVGEPTRNLTVNEVESSNEKLLLPSSFRGRSIADIFAGMAEKTAVKTEPNEEDYEMLTVQRRRGNLKQAYQLPTDTHAEYTNVVALKSFVEDERLLLDKQETYKRLKTDTEELLASDPLHERNFTVKEHLNSENFTRDERKILVQFNAIPRELVEIKNENAAENLKTFTATSTRVQSLEDEPQAVSTKLIAEDVRLPKIPRPQNSNEFAISRISFEREASKGGKVSSINSQEQKDLSFADITVSAKRKWQAMSTMLHSPSPSPLLKEGSESRHISRGRFPTEGDLSIGSSVERGQHAINNTFNDVALFAENDNVKWSANKSAAPAMANKESTTPKTIEQIQDEMRLAKEEDRLMREEELAQRINDSSNKKHKQLFNQSESVETASGARLVANSAAKKVNFIYSYKSRAGQYNATQKKINEDALFMITNFLGNQNNAFFGVCDGHGEMGGLVSSFVKKSLPKQVEKTLKRVLQSNDDTSDEVTVDYSEVLKEVFNNTEEELDSSTIDTQLSGTTCCTVFIRRCRVICANLGDSRALLARQTLKKDWEVVSLSNDHKPDVARERIRILEAGGRVVGVKNERGQEVGIKRVWKKDENIPGLAMTRSFGDSVARSCGVISEPEIFEKELDPNDKIIVIGSDGIFEWYRELANSMMRETRVKLQKNESQKLARPGAM